MILAYVTSLFSEQILATKRTLSSPSGKVPQGIVGVICQKLVRPDYAYFKVPSNDSKLNEEIKEREQIFILAMISVSPLPIVVVAL